MNTDNTIETTDPTEDMLMEKMISDGIQFVQSLTNYYGPEKGMEVWNSFGDVMGKTIQHKVFMAMLMGRSHMSITFAAGNANNLGNAIPVVKCIRQYTGLSLNEARDYLADSKTVAQTIKVEDPKLAQDFRRELRNLGCIIY